MTPARRLLPATIAALLLAACAPIPGQSDPESTETTPEVEETPEPVLPPTWPTLSHTPSSGIPGLDTTTITDNDAQIHVIVPQLESHDAFNAVLNDWAGALVQQFRDENLTDPDEDEPDEDWLTRPWLSATWGTTGVSGSLIGVTLDTTWSPGASTTHEHRVLWYNPDGGEFLTWKELLTEDAQEELPDRVVEGLRESSETIRRGDIDVEMLTALLEGDELAVGFTGGGGLVITFDDYSVLAGSYGSPAVAFTPEETTEWLTPEGKIARDATTDPKVADVPDAPEVPERPAVDCEENKCVALTFDDGPGGSTTPKLLKILDKEDVPATFFMLGSQAEAFPKIVANAAEAGHEIASHSWNHPSLPSLGKEGTQKQLTRTNKVLEKVTGADITLMRPPYGATDDEVAAAAKAEGLAQILWDIDTRDWEHRSKKKTIEAAKEAKAGSIILMHDIHPETVEAVPGVIKALKKKDYTFVTVSTLLGETTPGKKYFSLD